MRQVSRGLRRAMRSSRPSRIGLACEWAWLPQQRCRVCRIALHSDLFMIPADLRNKLAECATPQLADACLKIGVAVRCGPCQLRPAAPGMRMCGGVLPVRHVGSVDVFLEAFSREMSEIRLPLFSLGTIATGPLRLDARPRDVFEFANVGEHRVSHREIVV